MRWRLLLKEFGPELVYIKGPNNIVANALSHLGMTTASEEVNALQNVAWSYTATLAERYAELFADVEDELPHIGKTHIPYLTIT